MSLPTSNPVSPAASAAAEPPDDPPEVRETSQGLLVDPKISLNVWKSAPCRGMFVLPKITAPARLRRATASASEVGTYSA